MSKGRLLLGRTTVSFHHPEGYLIQKLRELSPVVCVIVVLMG